MRAFRLKLVEALLADDRTLSRNRHFDTFDDATGRAALRTSRYLRALERDVLQAASRGERTRLEQVERDGKPAARIELCRPRGKQVAYLSLPELRLLLERPGVRAALDEPEGITG